jgi:predicted RNA-binding Zn-ribbon protein involved in translation (DUF1610 family)
MNTPTVKLGRLIHVSLIPQPTIETKIRKHPMFLWYKKHKRSVKVEARTDNHKVFFAQYSDIRTGTIFMDKKFAEHYLGQEIPEPEYVGQQYAEKTRDVSAYCICKECGYVGIIKTEMIFKGPFNIVAGKISTSIDLSCPKCGWTIDGVEITTEPCTASDLKQDCDLAR